MSDTTETEQRTHTAQVHAWYVDSDGDETHVTRRDDGKWYLNSTNREKEVQFVPMETALDIFVLAVQEGRPHTLMPGRPGGEKWDADVAERLAEDEPEGEGIDDAGSA